MKLTIERATLLRSLGHVQSVVERRNTIPILSNIRAEAQGDKLGLTATDMDLSIVEMVPAEIAREGTTTAPAHTLYDIVRKLPEGSQIELDAAPEHGMLTLRSGKFRTTLACLPAEDFPAMSEGSLPTSFSLPAADLRKMIERTRFAISTEETRYYLNGIYLHVAESDGKLRAVATDGHRLARVEVSPPEGADGMPGVIVPRKTVIELYKLIDESNSDVEVKLSETKIRFAFDGVVLTSKLIDGTFPDYERVIPAGNDKVLEVRRQDFTHAVARVSAISSEKSRAIKLSLQNGALELSATSPDAGSASEELEVQYSDGPLEIGFNSRYLLDITQQIMGEQTQFVLADGTSPTIVRDAGDDSALYVLMPMRV